MFGLPCWRFQNGPWAIISDPAVNDVGYVICADRDSSAVAKTLGKSVTPGSRRRYNVADGVYVGGVLDAAPAATWWLKSDGTLQVTDSKGNVLSTSTAGFSFTGNVKVNGTLEATQIQTDDAGLNVTGNITATGEITRGQGGADQVTLGHHTHTQGVDSHGDTEQPTAAPTAGTWNRVHCSSIPVHGTWFSTRAATSPWRRTRTRWRRTPRRPSRPTSANTARTPRSAFPG